MNSVPFVYKSNNITPSIKCKILVVSHFDDLQCPHIIDMMIRVIMAGPVTLYNLILLTRLTECKIRGCVCVCVCVCVFVCVCVCVCKRECN